jgi:hypothetical protein
MKDPMETTAYLNTLKKHIFYEFLAHAGRVLILVRHSPDVVIGSRGFLEDEKESGVMLVFNSTMKFAWDKYGITATLVFGSSPQKCFIPADDIIAVYSPDANAQFVASLQEQPVQQRLGKLMPVASDMTPQAPEPAGERATASPITTPGNVIAVDFVNKTRREKENKDP